MERNDAFLKRLRQLGLYPTDQDSAARQDLLAELTSEVSSPSLFPSFNPPSHLPLPPPTPPPALHLHLLPLFIETISPPSPFLFFPTLSALPLLSMMIPSRLR